MRNAIKIAAALAVAAVYGQANYVLGFDAGTDTSLCVVTDMMLHERSEACDRLWVNSPAMIGTRAWRYVSGDQVPDSQIIVRGETR